MSFFLPEPGKATRRFKLGQRQLTRLSVAFVLVVLIGVGIALNRVYLSFKAERDLVITKTNETEIYKALRACTLDYDNKLPGATQWETIALGYLSVPAGTPGGRMSLLHAPSDEGTVGYVFNSEAAHYDYEPPSSFEHLSQAPPHQTSPGNLVLLIERVNATMNASVPIPPQNTQQGRDALYKLLQFPHGVSDPKTAKTAILYADGHIEVDTRRDFQD